MASSHPTQVFRTSVWAILIVGIGSLAALAGGVAALVAGSERKTIETVFLWVWTIAWFVPALIIAGRVTQRVIVSSNGLKIAHGIGHNMEFAWAELEWWQIAYVRGADGSHFEVRVKRKEAKRSRCIYDNEVGVPSFSEFVKAMRTHVPLLEIPTKAPVDKLMREGVASTPKSPGSSC